MKVRGTHYNVRRSRKGLAQYSYTVREDIFTMCGSCSVQYRMRRSRRCFESDKEQHGDLKADELIVPYNHRSAVVLLDVELDVVGSCIQPNNNTDQSPGIVGPLL